MAAVTRLEQYRRSARGAETVAVNLQLQWLRQVVDKKDLFARPEPYRHPFRPGGAPSLRRGLRTQVQKADGSVEVQVDGALSASEIAWLERLPKEPGQVSYADAQTLAGILNDFEVNNHRQSHPADDRLLRSVVAPIRHVYDLRAAEHEARSARTPLEDIPDGLTAAIAATTAADEERMRDNIKSQGLPVPAAASGDEFGMRASMAMRSALEQRRMAWEDEIDAADREVVRVREENVQRLAVTAP